MEGRGVLQDLIPHVGELELPQIPVVGLIIDPYDHGFLDDHGNAMHLPTNNRKTVHIDTVSRRLTMFINELFFTTFLVTLKLEDHPIFLGDGTIVLWGHQRVPDSVSFLEINLYFSFITEPLLGDN